MLFYLLVHHRNYVLLRRRCLKLSVVCNKLCSISYSFLRERFFVFFAMSYASLAQHTDVDIPLALLSRCGSLLNEFDIYLRRKCYQTRREQKADGNHLTPWWLYVRLCDKAPSRSEAQFGETSFAKVNAVPHMWSRAKRDYRGIAHQLLRGFIEQLAAKATCLATSRMPPLPPPPCRNVPKTIAVASFDGREYGDDYLVLSKGDIVLPLRAPEGVDPEGWAYGFFDGISGWYPPSFVEDV